jgi:hypothetical protein
MAPCSAICKNGSACKYRAKVGLTVCGKHIAQSQGPVEIVLCGTPKANGRLCTKVCMAGHTQCSFHVRMERAREERRVAQWTWVVVMETLWGRGDEAAARAILTTAWVEGRITPGYIHIYARRFEEEVDAFRAEFRVDARPLGDLEALAVDRQNVHTPAVNQQTHAGLEILLGTSVSSSQDTLREIESVWEKSHTRSIRMVLADMRQWYNVQMCRTEDDWLYRRTLDGLWAYIQASPAKDDLVERLWEECYESVRMCCDGHISRLCNVLCGFQEEFKPPVSVGELLQQRMAVIAEREIPVEEKVGEAWAVFEELAIPMDQRDAWIEAF